MAEMSEARREQLREAGRRGGQATAARHGAEHMARIGKLGFAATMERYGGAVLAALLGESYQAKYGRPLNLTTGRNLLAERERAATRRAYPELGRCERCGARATQRHHPDGWREGHGRIEALCVNCHLEAHRAILRAKREAAS